MSWELYYTKQAQKDAKKLSSSNLRLKAEVLLEPIKHDPFQSPPPFEKLVGDLNGAYLSVGISKPASDGHGKTGHAGEGVGMTREG